MTPRGGGGGGADKKCFVSHRPPFQGADVRWRHASFDRRDPIELKSAALRRPAAAAGPPPLRRPAANDGARRDSDRPFDASFSVGMRCFTFHMPVYTQNNTDALHSMFANHGACTGSVCTRHGCICMAVA